MSTWTQPTPANGPIQADPLPPSQPWGWLASWIAFFLVAWYALSWAQGCGDETTPWDWGDPESFGYAGRGLTQERREAMAKEWRDAHAGS